MTWNEEKIPGVAPAIAARELQAVYGAGGAVSLQSEFAIS
jgi:hypothetical protein